MGVSVATGKMWAAEPENLLHLSGSRALCEQVPGDPKIHDTPVGLRETLADTPSFYVTAIDLDGCGGGDAGWVSRGESRVVAAGWRMRARSGRLQQGLGSRRQAPLGSHTFTQGA